MKTKRLLRPIVVCAVLAQAIRFADLVKNHDGSSGTAARHVDGVMRGSCSQATKVTQHAAGNVLFARFGFPWDDYAGGGPCKTRTPLRNNSHKVPVAKVVPLVGCGGHNVGQKAKAGKIIRDVGASRADSLAKVPVRVESVAPRVRQNSRATEVKSSVNAHGRVVVAAHVAKAAGVGQVEGHIADRGVVKGKRADLVGRAFEAKKGKPGVVVKGSTHQTKAGNHTRVVKAVEV